MTSTDTSGEISIDYTNGRESRKRKPIAFARHLCVSISFAVKLSSRTESIEAYDEADSERRIRLHFRLQNFDMEALNFRLAEEKNFHSEVLLFTFNPEHDIIVICSANGDVKRVLVASLTM